MKFIGDKKVLLAAVALVIGGVQQTAMASGHGGKGHWSDSSKATWHNSAGECWQGFGMPGDCVAPAPAPEPAPRVVQMKVNVTGDNFDFDKANLKSGMIPLLDDAASQIVGSPGTETVYVTGHTDSVGSDAYNQRLSERRAASVAQYLASKGVPASSMVVSGKGESEPVADNKSASGRAQNRRVEVSTE